MQYLIVPRAFYQNTEVVAQRCSVKMVVLQVLQNSQENTFSRPCTDSLDCFKELPFLKTTNSETEVSIKFVLQNSCYAKHPAGLVVKIVEKPIKEFSFSKFTEPPPTVLLIIGFIHRYFLIVFSTDAEQLFSQLLLLFQNNFCGCFCIHLFIVYVLAKLLD